MQADAGSWENTYVYTWQVSSHAIVTDKRISVMKATSDLGITGVWCFVHTLRQWIQKVIIAQRTERESLAVTWKTAAHCYHLSSAKYKRHGIQQILGFLVLYFYKMFKQGIMVIIEFF